MESETLDLLTKVVLALITVFCFGMLGYFMKKLIDKVEENIKLEIGQVKDKQIEMNGSVKDVVEKHHACREELPKVYATKETVDKIFTKLDPIALDIGLIKKEIRKKERRIAQQT